MLTRRSALSLLAAAPFLGAGFTVPKKAEPRKGHHALVIGCDDYQSAPELKRAVADSVSMAKRLVSYGYAVTEAPNCSFDDFQRLRDRFLAPIAPGDMAFVFFAGHGVQVQGRNVLLVNDSSLKSIDRLRGSSIDLSDLLEQISAKKPGQAITLLDACRNSVFDDEIAQLKSGIGSGYVPVNFYIGYSASHGESALDRLGETDTNPNGVFTRAVLSTLQQNASFDAVLKLAKALVIHSAASIHHEQHPAIYDQTSGPFTIMGRTPTLELPKSARDVGTGVLVTATKAVLVGLSRYEPPLTRPQTPPGDVRALSAVLKDIGVQSESIIDSASDVLPLIRRTAESQPETLILYVTGMGAYVAGDGVIYLPTNLPGAAQVSLPGFGVLSALTFESLVEAGLQGNPKRRLLLLIDTCLTIEKEAPERGFLDSLALYPWRTPYKNVAILCSADFDQPAYDDAGGAGHSPFAIALMNALTRPGMTIREFGSFVRSEVSGMTEGKQEPALFAHPNMLCQKLTRPRSPEERGRSFGGITFATETDGVDQDETETCTITQRMGAFLGG